MAMIPNSYHGPAEIRIQDGEVLAKVDVTIHVSVRPDGRYSWTGRCNLPMDAKFQMITQTCRIVLADGRSGDIIVPPMLPGADLTFHGAGELD